MGQRNHPPSLPQTPEVIVKLKTIPQAFAYVCPLDWAERNRRAFAQSRS